MKSGIYCCLIADILTKFYRNVSWVVLYKTYLFCCNLLICLVAMRKNIQKSTPQRLFWGIKLKPCRIVSNNSLYKKKMFFFFFIAVAQALWLLWQHKVCIDLQWEKWKLAFTAVSLQIFWQKFYRNVSWVVLYKTSLFCCNLLICLVAMKKNIKKINSSEAVLGDKAETLQNCF